MSSSPGRNRGALLVCLAIVAISVAVNIWWLAHFRSGYPLDIDESRYLELGLRLSDSLSSGGPGSFWHVWSTQHQFGPLLPLLSVLVYLVLGHTVLGGLATQLVFFVILVLSAYGIASRLTTPAGAALAAAVVACAPAVIDFTRTYQFAITEAAVLAAATYALLASEAFTRRGWSLAWGLLVGLFPLARTMGIAFVPAQLAGAIWLVATRPNATRDRRIGSRAQIDNLVLGVAVGALAGASWLATSWDAVLGYLTNFGYGEQSTHFASSGSRLSVGYWTREALNSVRQDLYLPLAGLLALCLVVALAAAVARRRPFSRGVKDWALGDGAIVLFILLEGYVVISSSRNEGVGFRLPLLSLLAALVVAALSTVPWRVARLTLTAALISVCALNVVMKADVLGGVSGKTSADVPGLGHTPVLDGEGYIQGYVVSSLEARYGSATQPLPVSQRGWLPAYQRIVEIIFRLARRSRTTPTVGLATDEPLLNTNDLTLAARLRDHRHLAVGLLPAPAASASTPASSSTSAYERLVAGPGKPNVLVTVSHVGVSYVVLAGMRAIDQGLLERASEAVGFACGAAVPLPDGRSAVISWKPPPGHAGPLPGSCASASPLPSPRPNATGVLRAGQITVLFALPMDTASFHHAFRLTDTQTGRVVPGTVFAFGETALVFRARHPLAPRTRFAATLGPVTADTGGRSRETVRWSFTTGTAL